MNVSESYDVLTRLSNETNLELDGLCRFARWYGASAEHIVTAALACVGIAINTASAVVLSRPEMRRTQQLRQTSLILTSLAVTDVMMLAANLMYVALLSRIDRVFLYDICNYDFLGLITDVESVLFDVFWSVSIICHTTALCLVILLAVYRYVTVAGALKKKASCCWTMRTTWTCMSVAVLFSIALNIPSLLHSSCAYHAKLSAFHRHICGEELIVVKRRLYLGFKAVACTVLALLSIMLISQVCQVGAHHQRVSSKQVRTDQHKSNRTQLLDNCSSCNSNVKFMTIHVCRATNRNTSERRSCWRSSPSCLSSQPVPPPHSTCCTHWVW